MVDDHLTDDMETRIDETSANEESEAAAGDDEFEALLEESFNEVASGEIITGTVVSVTREHVVVDIGSKSEGIIPLEDYFLPGEPQTVHVGQSTPLFIVRAEDRFGSPILSRRRAVEAQAMEKVRNAHRDGAPLICHVMDKTKGGFECSIEGVACFMPLSHSGVNTRKQEEIDALLGRDLEVKVLELRGRKNVILSRRVLNDERRDLLRTTIQEAQETGALLTGNVKSITDFGAFVDLGGIDGLLHVQDMAWRHVGHPNDMVKLGDTVEVKVMKVEGDRISVSLKDKTPDPWEKAAQSYPEGTRVRGKVTNLEKYGAFVELEPGIEGLVHISELSWTERVNHPQEVLAADQEIEVMVLGIDMDKRRISLGYKQTLSNPWEQARLEYPKGTIITGTISGMQEYGCFVKLPNGLEGMVHVSDMSWGRGIKHPKQLVNMGDVVRVSVAEINGDTRRISLSMKDVGGNPWDEIEKKYPVNSRITVKVSKLIDVGAICEITPEIEGFCHVSALATERVEKPSDVLKEGEEVEMVIIKIDRAKRRVSLSRKAMLVEAERREVAKYMDDDQPESLGTFGEFLRDALGDDK